MKVYLKPQVPLPPPTSFNPEWAAVNTSGEIRALFNAKGYAETFIGATKGNGLTLREVEKSEA